MFSAGTVWGGTFLTQRKGRVYMALAGSPIFGRSSFCKMWDPRQPQNEYEMKTVLRRGRSLGRLGNYKFFCFDYQKKHGPSAVPAINQPSLVNAGQFGGGRRRKKRGKRGGTFRLGKWRRGRGTMEGPLPAAGTFPVTAEAEDALVLRVRNRKKKTTRRKRAKLDLANWRSDVQ